MRGGHWEMQPHTADIRMVVCAESQEDLFSVSMRGMMEILKPGVCDRAIQLPVKQEILLDAPDVTLLLIDFLSEVLTICHIEKAVFCAVTFRHCRATGIRALLSGIHVDGFDEDIKAVTYHEADVVRKQGKLETTIILDI